MGNETIELEQGQEQEHKSEEVEDRGDSFTPQTEKTDSDLDPEALAEIANSEGEQKPEPKPANHGTVPYDRFAEKVALAKDLEERATKAEAELEALRKPTSAVTETDKVDLKALRIQRGELLAEGEFERAADLDEIIETEITRQAEERAHSRIRKDLDAEREATNQQTVAESVAKVADAVIADFPVFDSTVEEPNQTAINALIGLRNQYATSMPLDQALRKAADELGPIFGGKQIATDAADKRAIAEADARKRAARASVAQPANIAAAGAGARSHALSGADVANMDEKTFDALPESEKRKLRGD